MSAPPGSPATPRSLPSLFVSHGAPTIVLEDCPARRFLAALGARLGRPRAVLVVSAHWATDEVSVMAASSPATVHDFYGFPPALYVLRYPASGAPALAARIAALLDAAGHRVHLDADRGYDHGAWIPMSLLYPAADVPVVQLSINPTKSAAWHWRLGRSLRPLCDEGVLIVGSGSMTHNLADFRSYRGDMAHAVEPYAEAFSDWFAQRLAARDLEALLAWHELAPEAARAHPSDEHLLPLFVALGAAGVDWSAWRLHHGFMHGAIAMDAYLFQSGSAVECASSDPFEEALCSAGFP
jgi:4,5-DOPA dioxygenase extradiol